jgi:putative transposase
LARFGWLISVIGINNSDCIRIEKGAISIPKVGKVPIVLHRKLASKIKTATVQLKYGKWYISLTQEIECKSSKQVLSSIFGHDINSQYTVVGSNDWYVKNPKVLKNYQQN